MRQRYLRGTNVLETTFEAAGGTFTVTDFMPLSGDIHGRPPADEPVEIHRLVHCAAGEGEVEVEWSPRFDYGRAPTRIAPHGGGFAAESGGERLTLRGMDPGRARIADGEHGPAVRARLRMRAGERAALVTRYGPRDAPVSLDRSLARLRETVHAWRGWAHVCVPPDACAFAGPHHGRAVRSALALKLLTQRHTGAVAAAATTSLPETIGGVRNWDYRFSWIRDSSLTARALFSMGHRTEARNFLEWVEEVAARAGGRGYHMQVMYGLHGETELPERTLDHLEGYRGSRPVRIGNAASTQLQLDLPGELMRAAYGLVEIEGRLPPELWPFLVSLADRACRTWTEPDAGIWEVRSEPRHFVHSKLMVWVALDRAIRMAEQLRLRAPLDRWRRVRREVRRAVLSEGFDRRRGTFVRAFGSGELDAACLVIPITGFLPPDDPRVRGTIDAIKRHLMDEHGLVYRYRGEDGLPGGEGAFLLCTFWLVDALALCGRVGEAREIMQELAGHANHLGLYAEEIEPASGAFRGNFPQAFSHVGFINSALRLADAERQGA